MGCGTHSHAEGDRKANATGIIFSHAYALLSVAEYDKNKLIKMRNPHGIYNLT